MITQFLSARLDCEVRLAESDDGLAGIGVLDDEVTGVARHHDGLDQPGAALADRDHLVGSDEMILNAVATVETCQSGLLNDSQEVAIVHVAEHLREVAAGPILVAYWIRAPNLFKRGRDVGHGSQSPRGRGHDSSGSKRCACSGGARNASVLEEPLK